MHGNHIKVTMNTTALEEQASAIECLYDYAEALGATFAPAATHALDAALCDRA